MGSRIGIGRDQETIPAHSGPLLAGNRWARALVEEALEGVRVDGGARRLIWPDGASLTIEQSVRRIGKTAAADEDIAPERIEEEVCAWLEGGYAPDDLTSEQFEELDGQVELWLEEHRRTIGSSGN